MAKQLLIEDIMTKDVISAGPENRLSQVLEFFTRFKIQHLPVAEDGRLIGIISVNDVVRFMNEQLKKGIQLSMESLDASFDLKQLMTKDPVTISPKTELSEVLKVLARGKFQAMPVTENGLLKGIITNKDMVRLYSRELNPLEKRYSSGAAGFGI